MGIEQKASEQLGEPVLATAIVSSKGTGKRAMAFGALGGAAGAALANRRAGTAAETLAGHKGHMVLALTPTRLGVFKQGKGMLVAGCGDLIESLPREEIAGVELGGGLLTSPVAIRLKDGSAIELEVPRLQKGKVKKLQSALSAG
jgi:hypothetical protein